MMGGYSLCFSTICAHANVDETVAAATRYGALRGVLVIPDRDETALRSPEVEEAGREVRESLTNVGGHRDSVCRSFIIRARRSVFFSYL